MDLSTTVCRKVPSACPLKRTPILISMLQESGGLTLLSENSITFLGKCSDRKSMMKKISLSAIFTIAVPC